MRISDWSSDVCSSDLADAPLGFHQSAASAPKCAASAASIVGVEAVIGNPWDVLLRKQEPREACASPGTLGSRSEEHTSELQSLLRISYAVFCLQKKQREH